MAVVQAVRSHLQYNVLPFYDVRLRSLARPDLQTRHGSSTGGEAVPLTAASKRKNFPCTAQDIGAQSSKPAAMIPSSQ